MSNTETKTENKTETKFTSFCGFDFDPGKKSDCAAVCADENPNEYKLCLENFKTKPVAEKKKYTEAANYLTTAAGGMKGHARVHYNLGMLLDYLGKGSDAERPLLRALEIEPANIDFLTATVQHYVKWKQYGKAKVLTERIAAAQAKDRGGIQ